MEMIYCVLLGERKTFEKLHNSGNSYHSVRIFHSILEKRSESRPRKGFTRKNPLKGRRCRRVHASLHHYSYNNMNECTTDEKRTEPLIENGDCNYGSGRQRKVDLVGQRCLALCKIVEETFFLLLRLLNHARIFIHHDSGMMPREALKPFIFKLLAAFSLCREGKLERFRHHLQCEILFERR
jgi:hypothetical protein